MVAIGPNHLEHIFRSYADLSLHEVRPEAVVVENWCGSMIFVSEVDQGLGFVYFLEVGVEVLASKNVKGSGVLPDTDGIGGVERVDEDSIAG